MREAEVIVVGAGVGGLVAALCLSHAGLRVTVVERTHEVGGKMHVVRLGDREVDAGPTVLTMRGVFDRVLGEVGARLDDELSLRPLRLLARHAWDDGSTLDLHADPARTLCAVRDFAGPRAADELRRFRTRIAALHDRVAPGFLEVPEASITSLVRAAPGALGGMLRADWHRTLTRALARDFTDPRLRQLFARYATYYGSSPFQAPATLALIAHVELQGVWTVDGGMIELARMLARLAIARGAELRLGVGVQRIEVRHGRATAAILEDGTRLRADAVVVNADPRALSTGLFGDDVRPAAGRAHLAPRSLSAITWAMRARESGSASASDSPAPRGSAVARGYRLSRHNVFFSTDYRAEFDALAEGRVPIDPTVYVHAQDRDDEGTTPVGEERLLCLVNAPAVGDREADMEISACRATMMRRLARCGLSLQPLEERVTTPADFSARFPATGGALYGPATHGPFAPFTRPPIRTPIEGVFLVGGGTHPGAGVPMVARSGLYAARAVLGGLASTSRSHPQGTPGGTSTRSPTEASTRSP